MSSRKREIKQQGQSFEVSEHQDDHLMPSAEELTLLKQVDGSLPSAIQKSAEKEQDFRHEMAREGVSFGKREQLLQHGLNYMALLVASGLGAGGLWFSYKLLTLGFQIQGSIFSGATLLYFAWMFLNRIPGKPSGPGKS
jgi:uncharacterized membrane protein